MRGLVLVSCVTVASCARPHDAPSPDAASSPRDTAASRAPAGPPADVPEMDFRGSFDGVAVWGTLASSAGAVSGSCVYEKVGSDLPLRGSADASGDLVLAELAATGPLSTIALHRTGDGAWDGTWQKARETRKGDAHIERIVHRPGTPVTVEEKRVHKKLACPPNDDGSKQPPELCAQNARVPFVVGLEDRAFQRTLNQALARASAFPREGVPTEVSYSVPLNERGFVSFQIDASFVDFVQWGFIENHADGLSAAVDAHVIARAAADFLDLKRAHAQLVEILESGSRVCVVQSGDPEQDLRDLGPGGPVAVVSPRGVQVLYDSCSNHVHADAWEEIPFRSLRAATRSDSVFRAVWAAGDGG